MTKTISGRLLPYVLAAMFICLYLLNNQNVGVLFLVAAAYFLSLLLLFFLFVPNLFNCIFGREFSLGASRCEIAADSAPDCKDAVVVTLEPPFLPEKNRSLTELYRWHSLPQEEFNAKMRELLAGNSRNDSSLRHAIYNNRECIPAIIEWLEEADLLGTKEDPCEKARRKLQHEQEHDTTNMRFDD